MKKQIIAALAALASVSMLCGFDNAETVDSLSEKVQAAAESATSLSSSMKLNLDLGLSMSDGSATTDMPVAVSGAVDFAVTTDPLAMMMDGSLNVAALSDGQEIPLKSYAAVDESGTLKTYICQADAATGEETWFVQDNNSLSPDIMKFSQASLDSLSSFGIELELAPEAADVDGTECYLLSTELDSDTFNTCLQKASELVGQDLMANEYVAMLLPVLEGVKVKIEYYIDTETYLPVSFHMDLNDSDLSAISAFVNSMAAMFASEDALATEITLTLNDFSIDMPLSYNSVTEIEIPEEALNGQELSAVNPAGLQTETE